MGIFQQFPYSNFHEMNLDQIIKIMREMQDEWKNTKNEWASYKEFIDNYFANLDVSEEVLEAMRIFALDGTLAAVVDPTIATETASWLADHITQPTTPAIDTSLTVAGAAADAKAAGDAIGDNSENLKTLRGDKNVIADVVNKYGYLLPVFDRKAWDYGNAVKVDSTQVVMTENIPYIANEFLDIRTGADVLMRVTFLAGSSVLANTGWVAGRRLRNALAGVDNVTVEYKYSDSRVIAHIGDIINETAIIDERDINYYVNEAEAAPMYYPALLDVKNTGYEIPVWARGAYDFNNNLWVTSVYTVFYSLYSYDYGDIFTVYNSDPATFKCRVTFFSNNVTVGNTSWQTVEKLTLQNVITGVDSFSVEIAYNDNRDIVDPTEIIKNFGVQTQPSRRVIDDISTMGIFETWATIGDSFSVGRWYQFPGGVPTPVKTSRLAWGSLISQDVGNTFLSLGIGGINTRTWLTAPASSGGGLALALASPKQDLYFLCLGINDTSLGASYIGTVADIHDNDYTQNADTFFGNYGKIIQQMKDYAPNALFIISKLVAWNVASVKDAYNDAIEEIAEHYGIPCIDPEEDDFFISTFWRDYRDHNEGHPTGMTYGGMAKAYQRLINKAMHDNPTYFMYYCGTPD